MKSVIFVLLVSGVAFGQAASQSTDAKPAFEVASIKPAKPLGPLGKRFEMNGGPGTNDPGLFTCRNCALGLLVYLALELPNDFQFSGPGWLDDVRFDVSAKLPPGASKAQFALMLKNLLTERFKLVLHHEQKEISGYSLTLAKGGPKFKPAIHPAPDDAAASSDQAGPLKLDREGYPILPPGTIMAATRGHARIGLKDATIGELAEQLSRQMRMPVWDATGLNGRYDFTISWAAQRPGTDASEPDAGPTLESAIQSQLGLKLESRRGPIDVVVVDHLEKVPTEN